MLLAGVGAEERGAGEIVGMHAASASTTTVLIVAAAHVYIL